MQSFPLCRIIRGPRDHSRSNRVCPLDHVFVDRVDFLPQILGGRCDQRSRGIDVPRNFENARPDCGEDSLDGQDNAVVEGVHRASCFRFADDPRYQGLNTARLDLDVDDGPVADEIERFGKRRNPRTVAKRELRELRRGELSDCLVRRALWMRGVNDRIVVDDDNPVTRRVHVQLDPIGSELDRALEGRERVLGMGLVRPPVSDALRDVQASTCSQAFLQVVAL